MNPVFSNSPESSDTYTLEEVEAIAEQPVITEPSLEEPTPTPPSSSEFTNIRRTFSKVGMAFLVLVIALLVASYGLYFALYFTAPQVLSSWWMSWVLSFVPLYGVALPIALLFFRRVPVSPHNFDYTCRDVTEEKPPFRFKHFLLLLIIAGGAMTAGGLLGSGIMSALSSYMDYDYANELNNIISDSPLWVTFIGVCICAPLGEELIFRKLLIDRTRRFGDLPSILLSGILFGLFHGNLFQFFYAAAVGMILAYIYTRTGKYWWCVLLHAFLNLMGSIVIPNLAALLPEDMITFTDAFQPLIYSAVVVWQYGTLIAGIVLFFTLRSRRKLSRGTTPLYRKNAASLMFLNAGTLSSMSLMLVLILINLLPIH